MWQRAIQPWCVAAAVGALVVTTAGTARIRAADEKNEAVETRRIKGHKDWVWSLALSRDGKTLVTGSSETDRTARVWDFRSGRERHKIDLHGIGYSAVFHPSGRRALVASQDKNIYVIDVQTGEVPGLLRGHTGQVFSLALTRDGKMLASASEDGTVKLWDLSEGGVLASSVKISGREVRAVALSPDGALMLTGDFDSLGRLWDTATGQEVARYAGHAKAVVSVAFSPDLRRVITGSQDNRVLVWDTQSGQQLAELAAVTSNPYSVAVSPDGRRVVAGLSDRKILVWELATGKLLQTIDTNAGGVLDVKFTPDGRELLAGCGDAVVVIYRMPASYPNESPAAPATPAKGKAKAKPKDRPREKH